MGPRVHSGQTDYACAVPAKNYLTSNLVEWDDSIRNKWKKDALRQKGWVSFLERPGKLSGPVSPRP